MTRRRKRGHSRTAETKDEYFLVSRGWDNVSPGLWRHPRCADAWPTWAAVKLEREDIKPLSMRADPWADVRGLDLESLVRVAREVAARPCRAVTA